MTAKSTTEEQPTGDQDRRDRGWDAIDAEAERQSRASHKLWRMTERPDNRSNGK